MKQKLGPLPPICAVETRRRSSHSSSAARLSDPSVAAIVAALSHSKVPAVKDALLPLITPTRLLSLVEEAVVVRNAQQDNRLLESVLVSAAKELCPPAIELLDVAAKCLSHESFRLCGKLLELAPRELEQTRALSSQLCHTLLTSESGSLRALGLQSVTRLSTNLSLCDAAELALSVDTAQEVVEALKRVGDADVGRLLVQRLRDSGEDKEAYKAARALKLEHESDPELLRAGREAYFQSLQPSKAVGLACLQPALARDVFDAAMRAGRHSLARHIAEEHGLMCGAELVEAANEEDAVIAQTHIQIDSGVEVQWIDAHAHLELACAQLALEPGPLALDCEWRPVPDGQFGPAEIVQLATRRLVCVVDVRRLSPVADAALTRLFAARAKVYGFGLESDLAVLEKSHPSAACWRALRAAKTNVECAKGESLRAVVKRVLGLGVDKTLQMSNWARRPLRADQLRYAAIDAWAIVRLVDAPWASALTLPQAGLGAPCFFCDENLRRLCKLLRAIGYDCLWEGSREEVSRRVAFRTRLERARREGRVFVSDDEACKDVEGCFFVGAEPSLVGRFRLLVRAFSLRTDGELLTRCTTCNRGQGFYSISKNEAIQLRPDVVTEGVARKVDEFWACSSCNIVVWRGPKFVRLHAQIQAAIAACHEDER